MAKFQSAAEAVEAILDGFQYLIMTKRTIVGREQYSPSCNADDSDDIIEDGLKRVKELRDMRERFETLMTGGIE